MNIEATVWWLHYSCQRVSRDTSRHKKVQTSVMETDPRPATATQNIRHTSAEVLSECCSQQFLPRTLITWTMGWPFTRISVHLKDHWLQSNLAVLFFSYSFIVHVSNCSAISNWRYQIAKNLPFEKTEEHKVLQYICSSLRLLGAAAAIITCPVLVLIRVYKVYQLCRLRALRSLRALVHINL